MTLEIVRSVLREVRERLEKSVDPQAALQTVITAVGDIVGADRVIGALLHRDGYFEEVWRKDEEIPRSVAPLKSRTELASDSCTLESLFIHDARRSPLSPHLLERMLTGGVSSFAIVPIDIGGSHKGWIEVHFIGRYYRWKKEDTFLLEECAQYTGMRLASDLVIPATPQLKREQANITTLERERERYARLAEYGNLIIVRTDSALRWTEVVGSTEKILGVSAEELLTSPEAWSRVIHPADLRRLLIKVRRFRDTHFQVSDEVRVKKPGSNEIRWLLLKGVPLFSPDGSHFLGWEGFGLDITEKRIAEEQLVSERRRIEALYEVARALEVSLGPDEVGERGLRALIDATGSDAGYTCFFDSASARIDVVATIGLSSEFKKLVQQHLQGEAIVRRSIKERQAILIGDVQTEPGAAKDIVIREQVHGALVAPCLSEDQVIGAVVLYSRRINKFSYSDLDLASAAASQIGLAARQARAYAHEKRQASALSALYELTHETSKHLTPRDVVQSAFPIMQRELQCKRMWIGVVNEQGTHIVGQGGFGPGMRGPILNVQIELALQHDFFDEALKTKLPVIVPAGAQMECSGLTRILLKLEPGMFVVVPLISVGRVIGVVVAEPLAPDTFTSQGKITLLQSMANEVATVIMARRFEGRMAETNKMKMASLLASGVAHNFNNLLQAIMGQASLLDMQLGRETPAGTSARMILAAAERGATLIKQLMIFSAQGSGVPQKLSLHQLFDESREVYKSLLGSGVSLDLKYEGELPSVHGDYSQLQQAITNLLVNAKEAIGSTRTDGIVKIAVTQVILASGEIDPDLPPGPYVRIDVEDNGPGMDHERVARCFEPFFTTKGGEGGGGLGFGGAGLGLSSAYAIVKNHGGILAVSSLPGEGATFSIYLPVAQGGAQQTNAPREQPEAPILVEQRPPPLSAKTKTFTVRSTAASSGDAAAKPVLHGARFNT